VALIGHFALVEVVNDEALAAFASHAQSCSQTRLIRGDAEMVKKFWSVYSPGGRVAHRVCRELLLEQNWPIPAREPVAALRTATIEDLPLIAAVNAEMAYEESGINPMERDPEGFRLRCARRVEQGRHFIWTDNGRLIFKADIISATPQSVYLEGIYVNPANRGKGYGLRCLSQLGRNLLSRNRSLCLTVNEDSSRAISFYKNSGYRFQGYCDTIYLRPTQD
jgi:predicted GNAT family acetyltransferase